MEKSKAYKSSGYTLHNKVEVVRGGAAYFARIRSIAEQAVYSIHFQTYIFDEDETGTEVADVLIAAAKRGILVYLMVDGYASQHLSHHFIDKLKAGGVHFRFFEPFLKSKKHYFGRRMHHKVMVADGRICMVAGVNISNRYNDMPGIPAWLDWAIIVEGDIALSVDRVCRNVWNRALFEKNCKATELPPFTPPSTNCKVRIRRNDWVYNRTDITDSYRQLFKTAQKDVTIMTSYFWPPEGLLRRMEGAAKRGVRVSVVLTGRADVPLAKYAERYLYDRLFRSNIRIYEYRRNVLHGKVAVRDDDWLTVGSYNLNNISAFASVEMNLDVLDKAVASEMKHALRKVIDTDCDSITKENFQKSQGIFKRLFCYLSYKVIQMLFFLFTFYYSQQGERV